MNELTKLEIEEVSLVDEGANPAAKIVLYKRKCGMNSSTRNSVKKVSELIDKLAAKIEREMSRSEDAQLLKQAEKYEILGENAEELARILKASKSTGQYEKLVGLLEKAKGVLEQSRVFGEIGRRGYATPFSVEKAATKLKEKDPNLSWRKALDLAYQSEAKR